MNIFEKCTYYNVNLLKLSKEKRDELEKIRSIDSDCSSLMLSEAEINKVNIPEEAIDYSNTEFDEDELRFILEDKVGKHPAYLVYGEHIKWNGASGYSIVDDICDTVKRDYDCSISIIVTPNARTLIGMESSHDAPTGAKITIIGLTNEEAEQLEYADFSEIEKFVEKMK